MQLYIFNKNLDRIGVIKKFESLIWTTSYNECGKFELHAPLTVKNIKLLEADNIIYKKDDDVSVDDGAEAGVIESYEKKADSTGKEVMVVKGRLITSYLDLRIIWNTINFTGTVEDFMRKCVNDNCISSVTSRIIPFLKSGTAKGYTETISKQVSYKNLLTTLEETSKTYNLGFRVLMFPKLKELKFDVYKGSDRSFGNAKGNTPVIFERKRKNLSEQQYTYSKTNYKNCALVGGQGEGTERKFTTINNEFTGLDRRELFIDAKDVSNKKTVETGEIDENGNKVTEEQDMTWSEYRPLLLQKGNDGLNECTIIETFEGKITSAGSNKFNHTFFLGDIVTVQDKSWNERCNTRITSVEEVYEGGTREIRPVFGDNIPTIIDKIKQLERR